MSEFGRLSELSNEELLKVLSSPMLSVPSRYSSSSKLDGELAMPSFVNTYDKSLIGGSFKDLRPVQSTNNPAHNTSASKMSIAVSDSALLNRSAFAVPIFVSHVKVLSDLIEPMFKFPNVNVLLIYV